MLSPQHLQLHWWGSINTTVNLHWKRLHDESTWEGVLRETQERGKKQGQWKESDASALHQWNDVKEHTPLTDYYKTSHKRPINLSSFI